MDSVFVGRGTELEKAGELLDAARSGTESVLCVEGRTGIGKTALARAMVKTARAADIARREREVLECLVEWLTDKEITATLNISPHTVGNHPRKIYEKAADG